MDNYGSNAANAAQGYGVAGQATAQSLQGPRTFDGIQEAASQVARLTAQAEAMLDRISPTPAAIGKDSGSGLAVAAQPSYAYSLDRLHQRIGELSASLDRLQQHI